MRIPTPEEFQREYDGHRLPWRAWADAPDGSRFDLYVPGTGEDDGPDEAPHLPSIRLAERLLTDLAAIFGEAAAYVRAVVDVQRHPLRCEPEPEIVWCDATRQRLIVELSWPDARPDHLWYVDLALDPALGLRPRGMGVGGWGKRGSPWPPLHVQMEIPRQRPGSPALPGRPSTRPQPPDAPMRIPAPDEFRSPTSDEEPLLWHAQAFTDDGTEFDLYVPGDSQRYDMPDEDSIRLAGQLLPDLPAIIAQAAEYVLSIVDVQRRPLFGEPQLVVFSCDARRQRVIVELNWETMPDALWYVEMYLHPLMGRSPIGMGVTPWAKHGSPWPPLHVQQQIPRQRPGEPGRPQG